MLTSPRGPDLTPSRRSSLRCSSNPAPRGSTTLPRLLMTLCQGSFSFRERLCRIRATCRAARGLPARAATWPYDATAPRGIERMIATARTVKGAYFDCRPGP